MTNLDNIINKVVYDPDFVTCLNENEIKSCLERVKPILKKEKACIESYGKAVFIGDTHGDFNTTKAIFQRFLNYDYLAFLGDYIDREPVKWGSINNIIYLLIMKCRYPEKIILLKGNHECNYAIPCSPYEFEGEIIQRFGSSELHERFVEVFSLMPLMILCNGVFAAHGGILKGYTMKSLRKISKNSHIVIKPVVWSDPDISSIYHGIGERFNKGDLKCFLDGINAKVFIRGHNYTTLGCSIFNDRCLTIFSSSRYKNMGNGGILVAIADKYITCVSDLTVMDFSTGKWLDYKLVKI